MLIICAHMISNFILDNPQDFEKLKVMNIQKFFEQGMCHIAAKLPFTLKKYILRQKKNYENSNISPCKNIIFKKKASKRNQNPSRRYHDSMTNLKVSTQAKLSCFKNPRIKIDLLCT